MIFNTKQLAPDKLILIGLALFLAHITNDWTPSLVWLLLHATCYLMDIREHLRQLIDINQAK